MLEVREVEVERKAQNVAAWLLSNGVRLKAIGHSRNLSVLGVVQ